MAFKALLMGVKPEKGKPNPRHSGHPSASPPAHATAPAPAHAHAHAHAPAHGLGAVHAHGHGHAHGKPLAFDDEKPKAKAHPRDKDADLLDPTTRMSAQLAPPINPTTTAATEEVTTRSRVSLEELIPQVVKRIAWGGDRVKGAVHLELHSGDKVTVHAEGRRVRVEVADNAELEQRIASRLRAAGIEVEGVR